MWLFHETLTVTKTKSEWMNKLSINSGFFAMKKPAKFYLRNQHEKNQSNLLQENHAEWRFIRAFFQLNSFAKFV